ncbi:hypothetical protein AB0F17_00270 [Nonomuraea sp. NPDC026600]|uniref:hypothetical protein n=1 Tax=Nonomuraea sp. NPDC026600 TaxID=3155363 RepID=UPI0033EB58DB
MSFTAYGRTVHLRNGAAFNHSFAVIYNGYQRGDQVWADRSINPMPANVPKYFSDNSYVTPRGGWKQCGPFHAERSNQVMNWNTDTQHHFAVRACFRPGDGRPSVCGNRSTGADAPSGVGRASGPPPATWRLGEPASAPFWRAVRGRQ